MLRLPSVNLGSTGLKVSRLGFGPLFDDYDPSLRISSAEGGRILIESYKLGISFWDTSDDYGTHPHIAFALKHLPRKDIVISTKTYAKSGEEARKSLKNSLKELGTDFIDIFLLHYVTSDSVDSCHQVLKELRKLKATGIVKAIGLSTHSVAVARESAEFKELDVIMTICCKAEQAMINKFPENIPLEDGSIYEMLQATRLAHDNGKGTIAMKVLGSGAAPLIRRYQSAIKAIAQLRYVDAMIIGMRNIEEVKKNVQAILSS
jgi:aryl-alcohol dehydrogenase-like predicted oxidoreductase